MIGIIGAMNIEVDGLKNIMINKKTAKIGFAEFTKGFIYGKECVVAVSGVGKVSAAICTQSMILKYNPDFIINIGIAGAINASINVGDFVIANDVVQHDMNIKVLGRKQGFIPSIDIINIPCSKDLIHQVSFLLEKDQDINYYIGTIASGDIFIGDNKKSKKIEKEFSAIACDMESGSIGQVCYMNKIKFCIIRAISDGANDSSNIDYPEFEKFASLKSIDLICGLLGNLG